MHVVLQLMQWSILKKSNTSMENYKGDGAIFSPQTILFENTLPLKFPRGEYFDHKMVKSK